MSVASRDWRLFRVPAPPRGHDLSCCRRRRIRRNQRPAKHGDRDALLRGARRRKADEPGVRRRACTSAVPVFPTIAKWMIAQARPLFPEDDAAHQRRRWARFGQDQLGASCRRRGHIQPRVANAPVRRNRGGDAGHTNRRPAPALAVAPAERVANSTRSLPRASVTSARDEDIDGAAGRSSPPAARSDVARTTAPVPSGIVPWGCVSGTSSIGRPARDAGADAPVGSRACERLLARRDAARRRCARCQRRTWSQADRGRRAVENGSLVSPQDPASSPGTARIADSCEHVARCHIRHNGGGVALFDRLA